MTAQTAGREERYVLTVPMRPALLVETETEAREKYALRGDDLLTTLPSALVRRWREASERLEETEHEIARWVKYSGTDIDRAAVAAIIRELPTADERKAARRKR